MIDKDLPAYEHFLIWSEKYKMALHYRCNTCGTVCTYEWVDNVKQDRTPCPVCKDSQIPTSSLWVTACTLDEEFPVDVCEKCELRFVCWTG